MYASLPCDRLLIGVDGSPLAAHIPDYLTRIRREFASSVKVIMTERTAAVVDIDTLEAATDGEVIGAAPGSREAARIATEWAELFVVVPATAAMLAKLVTGVADDPLSTAAMTSGRPLVIAPAMSDQQWYGEPVAGQVRALRAAGHYLIESGRTFPPEPGDETVRLAAVGTLLLHLWHVRMRQLRQAYWSQATATPPRTPAASKPVVVPLTRVTTRAADS